ncbi:MAG TPA: pyridoxamine 5'-phosphate oxidase family protein [Ktedonobacterales bacterium]
MTRARTANDAASQRARVRRHPERAAPERAEEILRAGRVAHVGYAVDGQPFVLPLLYFYDDGKLYLHGAPASRTIKALRAGMPVCVEVTLLDGLVASRDAKSHSVNYRSAMVFGTCEAVQDLAAKRAVFERMTQRMFSGRTAGTDYHPANEGDLKGVELLMVRIEERSAKVRSGPPRGLHDTDDPAGTQTGYVVELPGIDS